MSPDWLCALARYNHWMNDKLYGLCGMLSNEQRTRDCGAFFKSIHGTLNHLLVADTIWLGRFTGQAIPEGFLGAFGIRSLDQELYADFDELRQARQRTDHELSTWISSLTEQQLTGPLIFFRYGKREEIPLWWAVAHLFNHQTHHRGQITTLLTQQGYDIGSTDMFAMFRDEAAR